MSVKLRFQRVGMHRQPHFRLVAIDSHKSRDGKQIEVLGHYNPRLTKDKLVFKMERVQYWLSCGAQPSNTVRSLIKKSGQLDIGAGLIEKRRAQSKLPVESKNQAPQPG